MLKPLDFRQSFLSVNLIEIELAYVIFILVVEIYNKVFRISSVKSFLPKKWKFNDGGDDKQSKIAKNKNTLENI